MLQRIVRGALAALRGLEGRAVVAGYIAAFSMTTAAAEFSAVTIERSPQGVMTRGMIYISGGRLRSETSRDGMPVVVISDKSDGKRRVLYPGDHTYVELSAGGVQPHPDNPCAAARGASCIRLGDETVAGRPVTKWEIVFGDDAKRVRTYHWIDNERGIPLRQRYPDGTHTEWRRVGLARIEGRHVEKWEVLSEREGQPPLRFFQWLDPELQISVRAEMPGGFVREVREIRIGAQPDFLFRVPPDFRAANPVQAAGTITRR